MSRWLHWALSVRKRIRSATQLYSGWTVAALSAAGLYAAYRLTCATRKLTTDKSPYSSTYWLPLPSDYAIIESKWTGRRRVVELDTPSDDDPYVRQRVVRVNRLKDRLHVYLQKCNVALLFDAEKELDAIRFADSHNQHRDSISPPHGTVMPISVSSDPQHESIFVESVVRQKETEKYHQQKNVFIYRQLIERVMRDKIRERYHGLLLRHLTGRGVKEEYARLLIENGAETGKDICLSDIIPDLKAFSCEVFEDVNRLMGDNILLYEYSMHYRDLPISA